MTQWTAAQQRAIDENAANLLVSAAAGSGKTAVLIERIYRQVCEGMELDRLLVVTFTRAAASQMRRRLEIRLQEAMQQEKQRDHAQHLRTQWQKLSQASISTMDAFCLDLVRSHFQLLDLDPDMRVMDQDETELLQAAVLDDLLDERYQQAVADPADPFRLLVEGWTDRDDSELRELVFKLYGFLTARPDMMQWLDNAVAAYEDFDIASANPWLAALYGEWNFEKQGIEREYERLAKMCKNLDKQRDRLLYERSLLAVEPKTPQQWHAALSIANSPEGRWPTLSKSADESLRDEAELIKAQRDMLRKKLKKLHESLPNEEEFEYMSKTAPAARALAELTRDFHKAFMQEKQRTGVLSFADSELYALELLRDETVRQECHERYSAVYVDEYQDQNALQEAILDALGVDRFMVGDMKQSIYRFRQADPGIFLDKFIQYGRDQQGVRIDLTHNFRSRKAILDAVNQLFGGIMSRELGEMAYDESARMQAPPTETKLGVPVRVLLVDHQEAAEDDESETEEDENSRAYWEKTEREAWAVAKVCQDWHAQGCKWKDCVVLMSAPGPRAQVYAQVMTAAGVPFYTDTGGGYMESMEVVALINLLRLLDNAQQDFPLLSVLRSPLVGITGAELARIRLHMPRHNFFEAVNAYSLSDELAAKLRLFLQRLEGWRIDARHMDVDELLSRILDDTGFEEYTAALPLGAVRCGNLQKLIAKARSVETLYGEGLMGFLRYVERLGQRESEARTLSEHDDVVRLMSVHKSKGLEFPRVIVAGCGNRFNTESLRGDVIHKLGMGLRYRDPATRRRADTPLRRSICASMARELKAEEMRKLYVAMTRAQDALVLVGGVTNRETIFRRWAQGESSWVLTQRGSWLDWMGPMILREREDPGSTSWRVEWAEYGDTARTADMGALHRELTQRLKTATLPKELNERFSWVYPYDAAARVPSKLSVTQLTRPRPPTLTDGLLPDVLPGPEPWRQARSGMGASMGTLQHFVLQHLDLQNLKSPAELEEQVHEMENRELLAAGQAAQVAIPALWRFLQSPLGLRMRAAKRLWRELPFNMVLPAESLGFDGKGELVLVQGVVDAVFETDEGLVLLDYKTEYVASETEAAAQHAPQLTLYAHALETLLEKPLAQAYVVLLGRGLAVEIPLDRLKDE